MIGVHLHSHQNLSKEQESRFLTPSFVYIPVGAVQNKNIGDTVQLGEVLGQKKNGLPIFSSVEGTIQAIEKKKTVQGLLIDHYKIENKMKTQELVEQRSYDTPLSKDQFLAILQEAGILGMGGAGFPTYRKYDTDKPIKTLIVNAVECEPYISADYVVATKHAKEIAKTLHWMMQILNIKECYIAIKVKKHLLKEKLITATDKYKKITIVEVPDRYPMGWERSLVRYIKHTDYKQLPIEKGIVVNNISTIYAIHNALRYDQKLTSRMITVTGDVEHPQNIEATVGTLLSEIAQKAGKLEKQAISIFGGPMMGENVNLEEYPFTPEMNCILFLKPHLETESPCFRCGKCIANCPAKIAPVLIRDAKEEVEALKYLRPDKCIGCGICSFVCPAKINVREDVRAAKKKLESEKSC